MSKTPKKPAPQPAGPPRSPAGAARALPSGLNPRQKPDLRWQRSKRYNWDGR